MITAIILAGGVGSRVGSDRPKQFISVLGKPILAYTIDIFQRYPEINTIEIVCHKDWNDYCKKMTVDYDLTKVKWVVDGGETFQDSVMNGIRNLKDKISKDDYVLIQYGAAPFTTEKIVADVIRVMKIYDSSVTATPCYQLMGTKDEGEMSKKWIDREKCIQIACPYGFRFGYLLGIYARACEQGLLDKIEPHTTSLMYALGESLHLAYGDQTNIKITTREDVDMFEGYTLMRERHTLVREGDINEKDK